MTNKRKADLAKCTSRAGHFRWLALVIGLTCLLILTEAQMYNGPQRPLPTDEEDPDWYDEYAALVVDWEDAEIRDLRLPEPSQNQYEMRARARRLNQTDLVLEDLDRWQQQFYDAASTRGWKMMNILANVSRSLQDVTIVNSLTSGRLIRFTERVVADDFFKKNLSHIGLFFQALLQLNFKVRMLPEYIPPTQTQEETIKYRTEKYFNLDEVMQLLRDTDLASWQIQKKYDTIYGYQQNKVCFGEIKEKHDLIREAASHVYDFVYYLNNTQIVGGITSPLDKFEVREAIRKVGRICRGNTCYEAVKSLMSYIKLDQTENTPENCDIFYLTRAGRLLPGAQGNEYTDHPPCWRDKMLNKVGVTLQTIVQGLLVVGFNRQNLPGLKPTTERFLEIDFYPQFESLMHYIKYQADKCRFEQQGEAVAKESLQAELDKIWELTEDELNVLAESGFRATRGESLSKYIQDYLNDYHSDMRWMVKYYKTEAERFPIHQFRGTKFYYLNYLDSGENIIIYGAPQHEYFYEKFNNEIYHEFCYPEISLDLKLLGLID